MPTIWNMGATRKREVTRRSDEQPPSVSVGGVARIWRAPMYITVPPTTPISMVAERLMSEMAVSERMTLSSRRCTPPAKTRASRGFGVIALDDAHAGERFGQASGDLGVDLAALAENRADLAERLAQPEREHDDEEQRDAGQQRADSQQDDQREHRSQHAADEIHQAGADQVAHAFHVAHDARDQRAGLVGVVVGHGQPADVLLHFAAQLGDQPLPLFGEQLGQGETM